MSSQPSTASSSASSSRKRLFSTEYDDLKSVSEPTERAKLHGVVSKLSPMKDKGFFDAIIGDNTGTLRLVGFTRERRNNLEKKIDNPVQLQDCTITKSRYSDSMEVLVNATTKVTSSPRKFTDIVQPSARTDMSITLDQIQDKEDYQPVTVSAKVLQADPKLMVKSGLYKQDLHIADNTATSKLTVWQDTIDTLRVGTTYKLQGLSIRTYKSTKFLTTIKGEFSSMEIPNLENCKNLQLSTVTDAAIEGAWVTKTTCCQASTCNGSVQPTTTVLGGCTKCQMAQMLATCGKKMSARILVTNNDEHLYFTVPMQLVAKITGEMQLDDPETVEELLSRSCRLIFALMHPHMQSLLSHIHSRLLVNLTCIHAIILTLTFIMIIQDIIIILLIAIV